MVQSYTLPHGHTTATRPEFVIIGDEQFSPPEQTVTAKTELQSDWYIVDYAGTSRASEFSIARRFNGPALDFV
jgi:hypothetical protein